VEWNGIGKGGDVRISTGSLSVTNDAQLSASTNGQGDAGNVIINARDRVSFDHGGEASSAVGFNGTGKGGDIRISTDSLFVTNDARLIASTNGQGDAGNVIINARDHVLFDNRGGALSRVDANKKGNGGEISITASSLSLTNWSQLTASTDGQGNAGNVIINAKNSVWLDNISTALSLVNEISTGNGGDILITTGSLSITNGAALSTRTRGQGDAGNIQIKATDSVSVSGTNLITGDTSALFTLTGNNYTGKGGNINIDTKALRVSDGALLDARTENNGKGGDITVNAGVVEVLNGGQIVSSSFGSGSAGKITINTTDQLIVNGSDATYFNRTAQFPEKTTTISPSSGFFVLSSGTGTTGEIFINSPKITLDNGGSFIAESASGNGGNINLNVSD
jgi:large exoprotein involved in heme utilization and adhesion